MHCLSAIVGGPPASGLDISISLSRGSVLSVIQALGVLVCEGRIQGSPRGYKEGPHCAAPLQSEPSHHVCEKNDYLCNRYFVLVKEISDRVSIGANLCVEVFMCCECPCGHATAICNNPVSPIPATSIMQWQQCELLLEYWLIGVVSSKSSEMMNSQGLYQAVRSRLHFSQVAAWWSRSQGAKPAYIVTRVVPCAADNLSKFRETPIEHTFPQASIGDGNSVKVTVWALPRMEDVPTLTCPLHKEEECAARALTPTKTVSSCVTDPSAYVLPALVDDRLQTPCNQPGKHHCRCEDEDGCPPSLSIKSNGERKRRRSLPCGPSDVGTCTNFWNLPLASVRETCHSSIVSDTARTNRSQEKRAQVSLEIPEGNEEKRYKPSSTTVTTATPNFNNSDDKFNCFTPYVESTWLSKSDRSDSNVDKIIINNRQAACETNRQVNPSGGQKSDNLFVYHQNRSLPTPVHCADALNKSTKVMENSNGKDLSQLMSKLSFPKDTGQQQHATMINWMSKTSNTSPDRLTHEQIGYFDGQQRKSKFKNFLPLSQRESDEILTVLRGKTPSARRRTAVKMLQKRLEHVEKIPEDESGADNTSGSMKLDYLIHSEARKSVPEAFNNCSSSVKSEECVSNKADVLLRAILRNKSDQDGLKDISSGRKSSLDENSKSLTSTNSRILAEDEKFLPSVLNKKLHRFKQLFKKEHDKKEIIDPKLNYSDSYVKRKYNLTNCQTHKNDSLAALHSSYPISHSTNFDLSSKQCQILREDSSLSVLSLNRHDKTTPMEKKIKEDHYRHGKNPFFEDSSGILEEENTDKGVPSVIEQEQFRRSLENAASMVFHSRTGLPLTSSPAPLRRGSSCFDYDSSLNSVSSKRSALFELNTPPSPGAVSLEEVDRETEITGEGDDKRPSFLRNRPQSHALLGNFEESALNGRLEPVSTVHGFTAEIGASGSFCPKHRKLPVTVFFYTLGDNDKVSTPYLAHLNLGKKGYQVPRNGTIQVTLLNPLGTVVKMFVVLYDLSDMPPRSHTFLRQRTLRDKTLRYLIHLRFMSGKTGRIYLHTDIRIIICRKSDVDTASDFSSEPTKELRSYIHGPSNPKFSPRC